MQLFDVLMDICDRYAMEVESTGSRRYANHLYATIKPKELRIQRGSFGFMVRLIK
jgi:hypothetical protein